MLKYVHAKTGTYQTFKIRLQKWVKQTKNDLKVYVLPKILISLES